MSPLKIHHAPPQPEPHGRRLRRLEICVDALACLVNAEGRFRLTSEEWPDDARIVQTAIDPRTGNLAVFVESARFEEVLEGCPPPPMRPWVVHRYLQPELTACPS